MLETRDLAEKFRARQLASELVKNLPRSAEGFPATCRLKEITALLTRHYIPCEDLKFLSMEIELIRASLNRRASYLRSVRGEYAD
jgi:hypothetical protein